MYRKLRRNNQLQLKIYIDFLVGHVSIFPDLENTDQGALKVNEGRHSRYLSD